ncbi:hypothetical protein [Amycolatopsis sp. EV170708-02-1]|uniref:hypothetical protein n=1 Tax=Amycolatopsis sp. EV170708-02-1 TaxID=2919322 RepID=UPI001F0C2F66|nr:hypothetical protein [Amycolatopsis sp. EV170708-02-1]UMO99693.1 hypothetical protein MJQ72_24515 [Amycolatopsis sp. EV170708-02-1]
MSADRVVQLHWEPLRVADDDGHAALSYPGISVVRRDEGEIVDRTWIPVGEEPTFADDEALITALHAAWRWARPAA